MVKNFEFSPSLAINVSSDDSSSDEESLSPNNAQGTQRSIMFEIESLNLALKDVRTTCRSVKSGEKISRESWYDIIGFYVAIESRYLRCVMEARGAQEPAEQQEHLILLDNKRLTSTEDKASLVQVYEDVRDQA